MTQPPDDVAAGRRRAKIAEWTRVQEDVARRVREEKLGPIECIAGMDVSPSGRVVSMVTMTYPRLELLAHDCLRVEPREEYEPFFLAFRELAGMQALFARQQQRIGLVLVDGNGLLHPRRCGLASHFGVAQDVATVGVAKNRVAYDGLEVDGDGRCVAGGAVVGQAVTPAAAAKKIWVSVGHRCTLEQAVLIVRQCTHKHRVPEPIRLADQYGRWVERGGAGVWQPL